MSSSYAGRGSAARARASNRSGAPANKLNLAPADRLKRHIQAVLTDDLRSDTLRDGYGKYDGFAYAAAEAYFHLAGGYSTGLQPMQLKYRGKFHWWLLDKDGRVIDMTLGPSEISDFPYHRGNGRPFRFTAVSPSRCTRSIIERVREKRG